MLRLEKTSDLSNVAIRMRERERFFEPRLLKALTIAILIHSGALILFHVTPFSFDSTFTFPPVHVQSDSPAKGVSALVYHRIDEEEMNPPSISLIPALDWISFSQESTLVPSVTFNPQDLKSLEERVWPKWEEPLSLKLEEPRIQLAISGDLAEIPLVASDPLLNQMQPISSHDLPAYVTYQVQLDEKKGEIFWYDRITPSMEPAIDQLTEKILLNLRFAPPENQEPVLGILNFTVLENIEN
jgi:hypothetical protein